MKESYIENLLLKVNNIWIFQANPQRYDIKSALEDPEVVSNMCWSVKQFKEDIKKGDVGMIWLSGKKAGIYAVAEIISDPQFINESDAEKKYWVDIAGEQGQKLRVKMKITHNMVNHPLAKETIRNIGGLQDLSILKMPRGTNFKVSFDEWNCIKKLIIAD